MAAYESDPRAYLQARVDDHGFLSWLDVGIDVVEPGHLEMRVPYRDEITNPTFMGADEQGTIHGGVAATLIDTAGGLCVRTELSDPIDGGVATIDLNVSYLRPATDDMLAIADVIRVGRSVGVAEVTVESTTDGGDRATVAVGRGSYRVYHDGAPEE